MIKKIFSALVVVLFATSMMAQSGLTCEDPIPVDKSYMAHVEAESELWYTAWSYDLPMHVYFSPDSLNSEWGPEVSIDFSCTGDYSFYHKLDSVLNIFYFLGFLRFSHNLKKSCTNRVRNFTLIVYHNHAAVSSKTLY